MPEPIPEPTLDMDDLFSSRLRDGLHALPVPAPAPDFDARVLQALSAPRPWWQRVWQPAQPILLGASCSLGVTLLLLHWTLSAPITAPRLSPTELAALQRANASASLPSVDALLDRPDLDGRLLTPWGLHLPPPPAEAPPAPPPPRRRAQSGPRLSLSA